MDGCSSTTRPLSGNAKCIIAGLARPHGLFAEAALDDCIRDDCFTSRPGTDLIFVIGIGQSEVG